MVHPQEGKYAKNYEQFQDALSAVLIEKISRPRAQPKRRAKSSKKGPPVEPSSEADSNGPETDAEELGEFIDYIASEIFSSLPEDLQGLEHHVWASSPALQERYALPLAADFVSSAVLPALDPSIADSLLAYGIITVPPSATPDDAQSSTTALLAPVLTSYVAAAAASPPPPISTKAQTTCCEICGRDWVNLSYHHLIPRMVHAKAVKRGWHRQDELQNVAWLCGACHRFVHRFASHEDLARRYHTVELLMQQAKIVAFAQWVGRLRWKGGSTRGGRRTG
ncbi:hypothetical protein QBC33DRAFT_541020 [Phialemonium atrogriseum]|uniref:HNH domain-containing protein n=1 Tax=Phialemonium atrogriseum TaxID=1093897 RepID=A0AAJ0BYY0_9PEZI|nr:uncharacterized protein QBC33DRAFT_541020 [Phialemonium atrogriseum]KAK1766427.1 hypothetical protein QBC33DRAFT_541020 [Phialemonium atrogriseum]